jgi:hypothetical protein
MSEAAHYLGVDGRPAPEIVSGGALCAMTALIGGEPIACNLPAGHRGPHGFADLPGAPRGSRPPGRSGAQRTAGATAAGRAPGGPGARRGSAADMCGRPDAGGAVACAFAPGHGGKHSWGKLA